MQSSFRILLQGDGVLLAMASELLEPQLADLKKYAVFSKSKLTDESPAWARFGVANGDHALSSLGLALPAETDSVVRADALIALRVSPAVPNSGCLRSGPTPCAANWPRTCSKPS